MTFEKVNEFAIAQSYRASDSICEENGYLYTLSNYGLEIYDISISGELTLLSRYPIPAVSRFIIKDEFAYITTQESVYCNLIGKLFQVNISDKENPYLEQQLDFDFTPYMLKCFGNYLYFYGGSGNFYTNYFYSIPDLSIVAQSQNYNTFIEKLSDTTALGFEGNDFIIYDVSNPLSVEIIGNGNPSLYHPNGIHRIQAYNDSILICTDNNQITFWDISNLYNWQFISEYIPSHSIFSFCKPVVYESVMLLIEFGFVELLDISDPTTPQQIDIIGDTACSMISASGAYYENNLYIASENNGIQRISLNNNILIFEEEIAEFYNHDWVTKYNDYLITGSSFQGSKYFDISNPMDPIYLGQLLPLEFSYYYKIAHALLAVRIEDSYDFNIYDISDIQNLSLRNTIEGLDNYALQEFDSADSLAIYIINQFEYKLQKYDIYESGNSELIYELQFPFYPYWNGFVIQNGYGYFVQDTGNYKNLYIYSGLDSNEPSLCNTIYNISSKQIVYLKLLENYLSIYTPTADIVSPINNTIFYDISNPESPEEVFELSGFGQPYFHNDLIFSSAQYSCNVYVPGVNPTGILEPTNSFYDISGISNLSFVEYNNQEFLFLNQYSNFSVFEYNPLLSNPIINRPACSLSNHPNPFNPSTEISFQISDYSEIESAEIVIYNIKGQKVKVFTFSNGSLGTSDQLSSGQHSITWDGTDQNNQVVSSGVYFYQLEVDGKAVANKKCLLLK